MKTPNQYMRKEIDDFWAVSEPCFDRAAIWEMIPRIAEQIIEILNSDGSSHRGHSARSFLRSWSTLSGSSPQYSSSKGMISVSMISLYQFWSAVTPSAGIKKL